jgi:glutamine synthetase
VKGLKEIFDAAEFRELASARMDRIREVSGHISALKAEVKNMVEERKKANVVEDIRERAKMYSENVYPYLDLIRDHIDRLELTVDNESWPLPKYRELLFVR